MQENINYTELEQKLIKIKTLTENVQVSLNIMNDVICENINSGVGIWDSPSAKTYRDRWTNLSEDFPKIIEIFTTQEKNLETFINNMKIAN